MKSSASGAWIGKGMTALLLSAFSAGLPMSGRLLHAVTFSLVAALAGLSARTAVHFLEERIKPLSRMALGLLVSAFVSGLLDSLIGILFPALRMELGAFLPLAALAPFAFLVPGQAKRKAYPAVLAELLAGTGLAAFALCLLASIRELLSSGTISFSPQDPVVKLSFSLGFVALGAGALIASGYLLAATASLRGPKEAKE